jgi:hypothetical protein
MQMPAATSPRPCHHTRLRRRTHLNPRPCPRSSPPRYRGRYPAGCCSPSRLQLYLCSPRHAVAIAALELHHGVHSCSHGHNHLRRYHPRPRLVEQRLRGGLPQGGLLTLRPWSQGGLAHWRGRAGEEACWSARPHEEEGRGIWGLGQISDFCSRGVRWVEGEKN